MRSQQAAHGDERPRLSIVTSDGVSIGPGGGELSPLLSLPAFFERYILPVHLVEASGKTIKEYRTTLKHWVQFTATPAAKEGPPLCAINANVIGKFRSGLKTLPGNAGPMKDNSRRKHCTNLQFILDRAGPQLRRELETAQLVADVPYVSRPPLVLNEVEDNYSLAEIGWFLEACAVAEAPAGLPLRPATFWRCLGLFDYNLGARPQTLLALQFKWLVRDESGWWLVVPPEAFKTKRGVKLYVNAAAMALVERMRACGDERIFPWPHEEGWLHTTRRRILAASQIPEHRRHLGFKAFRKACATQLARINPMAASIQLGHSSGRNVTRDFYVNRQIVAEACEKLPQPTWSGDFGQRQMTLF